MGIYYNPEDAGLEIVASIGEMDYDWTLLVVWKDSDGRLFYGEDSGCSCNSPWEEEYDTASLTQITKETWNQFLRDVKNFSDYRAPKADKDRFVRKIRYRVFK